MSITERLRKSLHNSAFSRVLSLYMGIGVIMLAMGVSITTAYVTTNQIQQLLIDEGMKISETLASQSVLALVYESSDNVQEAASTTLSYPAVQQVALYNTQNKSILSLIKEGANTDALDKRDMFTRPYNQASLLQSTQNAWHFIAPVYTPVDNSDAALFRAGSKQELLGHVYLVMHKDQLNHIQKSTFINNITIAVMVAIILIALLHLLLKGLTRPIDELSNTMRQSEAGKKQKYNVTHAPKEVLSIANAYNQMIEAIAERDKQLQKHNTRLEREVNLRTKELSEARDAAVEASSLKSKMLANMSHELRTPLQSIIGYTDIVLSSIKTKGLPQEEQDLQLILKNSEGLLSQINNILDLAKIESGKLEVETTQVNLHELIFNVIDTITPLTSANNNKLIPTIDVQYDAIYLDETKIRHILLNLLGNSAKFTQNGVIRLDAKIENNNLIVIVTDTGIGIAESQQKTIFEPFRQVDSGLTREYQGTGLGLSITKQFVELLHGKITVTSQLNKGSTFTVILPVVVEQNLYSQDKS